MSPPIRVALYCRVAAISDQISENLQAGYPVVIDPLSDPEELRHWFDPAREDVKNPPAIFIAYIEENQLTFLEKLFSLKKTSFMYQTPVIVWSNRLTPSEISAIYRLGAAAVIHQSDQTNSLAKTLSDMGEYWFKSVVLPKPRFRG